MKIKKIKVFSLLLIFLWSCADEDTNPIGIAEYDPTPYELNIGHLPAPNLPTDNSLTEAGVALGRMLFYEKMLSKDGSQACADCHKQLDGFSDIRKFSIGVEGLEGKRQAMGIFNLAWHQQGFFWDGRAATLRQQALMPIQDPLEMNETLENVQSKLSKSKQYRDQFIRAFGNDSISSTQIGLALEQFMFSIVSANSKYDQHLRGEATFTESEIRGEALFFSEFDPFGSEKGAECFHCHAGANFTNNKFMNNGLSRDNEFTDKGLYDVTGNPKDIGKFKVPSLRNIALTPPYMHDGRFNTLEEVLDHYHTGVVQSSTIDPLMHFNLNPGLELSAQDKADIIAFLHTLTDNEFVTNRKYSSPF